MSETKVRRWQWEVDAPLSAIWEIMADTARFNEAAGLPKHTIEERPQADGSVLYLAQGRVGLFALRWREIPVNWVREQWFEHRRVFLNGPLRHLTARLVLAPSPAGCRVTVEVETAARNLIGRVMLKTRFWPGCEAMYGDRIAQARDHAKGLRPHAFAYQAPKPDPGAAARGAAAVARIEASGHGHGKAAALLEDLFGRQEVDLIHLRPLVFARDKGLETLAAIELFLQATREGLLDLRWDLLCPRCGVPKDASANLDALPQGAHCGTCNIDYDGDFSKNVELSFSPAPAIRPVEAGEYCLFGPMSTPHIPLHLTLAPGELREAAMTLPPSLYRWRTLEAGPETEFTYGDQDAGMPRLLLLDDAVALGPPEAPGRVVLENRSGRSLTAILEEMTWARDALTADRVTSLQTFRDLFSDQVLRPGDEVAIRRIALLFTDLKGSTALYTRIGDAAAYHLVRDHFAYLAGIVRDHEGAVVKTIGDAVMASFVDPQHALEAALEIQRQVAGLNAGLAAGQNEEARAGEAIVIKLGLHEGPAIAVTLNDQLDYFGQTVNMAARLQGESRGGDIVLSQSFAAASDAEARLADWSVEREETTPKGFDAPVAFYRAVPR